MSWPEWQHARDKRENPHDPPLNPLAVGDFCDTCGTRIEAPKPCAFGPHEETAS